MGKTLTLVTGVCQFNKDIREYRGFNSFYHLDYSFNVFHGSLLSVDKIERVLEFRSNFKTDYKVGALSLPDFNYNLSAFSKKSISDVSFYVSGDAFIIHHDARAVSIIKVDGLEDLRSIKFYEN